MRMRHGRRVLPAVTALAAAAVVAACTLGVVGGPAAGATTATNGAPGVTAKTITVGAVSTLTGPIAGAFDGFVPGMQAYFKMVDAEGGVDGRKIVLPTTLSKNTGGTASTFTSLAKELVEQDHVFAMAVSTFVASAPGFLGQTGTPTYGFNTSGNWTGPPNLFAYSGSVLFYTAEGPQTAFLMKETHSKKIGILAYNVTGSKPACTAAGKKLKELGITVAFENLSASIGSTYSSTVQRMKSDGVDFVLSCMQDTDNVSLARSLDQYGVKAHQLWLTGGGQKLIDQYPTLMTGIFMSLTSVPFAAPTKDYPGLKKYLTSMRKYRAGRREHTGGHPGLGIRRPPGGRHPGGREGPDAEAGGPADQQARRLHRHNTDHGDQVDKCPHQVGRPVVHRVHPGARQADGPEVRQGPPGLPLLRPQERHPGQADSGDAGHHMSRWVGGPAAVTAPWRW